MPEGDTLFRTAATLRKALGGDVLKRFKSSLPGVQDLADRAPLPGRTVSAVEARGKHLLVTFSPLEDSGPADLVLHTHLRMTGSWHVYRHGEEWRKPERRAVVTLSTERFVAPCFSAPVVELLTRRQCERHPDLRGLGPDAMTEAFDPDDALRRLRRRPDAEIAVALLNQRLMAGVGNEYKSEILFLRRVSPFTRVGELSDEALAGLIAEAHVLMQRNDRHTGRRTRFGLNHRERVWVYGRSGEPCAVCGETVRMRRQGLDARSTYYCPRCQGVAG